MRRAEDQFPVVDRKNLNQHLSRRLRAVHVAVGAALLDGKRLNEENDFEGWRKVIDFSGDSPNSYSGPSISSARDEVVVAGITINGLAILSEVPFRSWNNVNISHLRFSQRGILHAEPADHVPV